MLSQASGDKGFSLIETMVVVFIVGLVASMAVIAIPQRDKPEEASGKDIVRALRMAEEASLVSGLPHGLRLSENGFEIVRLLRGQWVGLNGIEEGIRGAFGEGVECALRPPEDASRARRDIRDEDTVDPLLKKPEVWFDPIGQASPVEIDCEGRSGSFTVALANDGTVSSGWSTEAQSR